MRRGYRAEIIDDEPPIRMVDFPNERVAVAVTCGVCGCCVPAGAWVVATDVGVLACSSSCLAAMDSATVGLNVVDLLDEAKGLEREAENLRDEADELERRADELRATADQIRDKRRAVPLLEVA